MYDPGICVAVRGCAWPAVVWSWELTYLSRLSQDDGTFGRSKLPQTTTITATTTTTNHHYYYYYDYDYDYYYCYYYYY